MSINDKDNQKKIQVNGLSLNLIIIHDIII